MVLLHVAIWIIALTVMVSGLFLVSWFLVNAWSRRCSCAGKGVLLCLAVTGLSGLTGYGRMYQVKQVLDQELAYELDGASGFVEGEIASIREKGEQHVLVLDTAIVVCRGNQYELGKVLVYLETDLNRANAKEQQMQSKIQTLCIGRRIRVRGDMQAFAASRNPGEFDSRIYYRSLKITYRIFGKQTEVLNMGIRPYDEFLHRTKEKMKFYLGRVAEPTDLGIFQAAILGDKDALDDSIRDLYQKNGIAHLLAISGLHVSIIGMCFYGLLRKTGLGYGAAGILGGILVLSYGVLTGASASVLRAVIMLLCAFGAGYLGRTYDLLSAAGFAALLLLWDMPYLVLQGGFQLSFGAILAIGAVIPCLTEWLEIKKGWQSALIGGISIQLVTYPVILYHFFQYPIYGILLNLLVIPLMVYVIASGMLGIFFGSFWIRAGVWAIGAGHYVLRFYEWLCALAAALPGYNLVIGRPALWQLGVYYFSLTGFLLWVGWQEEKKRAVCRWRLLCVFLMFAFFLLWPLRNGKLHITFLDVGQGDGIVLETREVSILIDGGSSSEKKLGEYRLIPYLKSRGIGRLDYAVVSHADADHISGLRALLEGGEIKIDTLILPYLGREEEAQLHLQKLQREQGGSCYLMKDGDQLQAGKLEIACLYPGIGDPGADKNDHSLVLKVSFGAFHMLLTGDMTKEGEQRMGMDAADMQELKEIQVLKVAHHGSNTSSSEAFLKQMPLRVAILSYAEKNSYGHPHSEVVHRLNEANVKLWETAKQGAIMLRTDGRTISVDTWISEKR